MTTRAILRRELLLSAAILLLVRPRLLLASTRAFTLEDQWERPVESAAIFGSAVVLIGGDGRHTGDRVGEWVRQLDGVRVFGIADLDSVPFFIPRGAIRKDLRKAVPTAPVLLDWTGAVYAPLLGFPKRTEVAVQVYGGDGALLARVLGPASSSRVEEVRRATRG